MRHLKLKISATKVPPPLTIIQRCCKFSAIFLKTFERKQAQLAGAQNKKWGDTVVLFSSCEARKKRTTVAGPQSSALRAASPNAKNLQQSLKKQTGAAIIVALFITSLVAIAAMVMINRLSIDMRNTSLLINATQGNFYAQGSIAWAMEELNSDWLQKKDNKAIDALPIQSTNHMGNTTITGTIEDAQGRFNINNLSDKKYVDDFTNLITVVDPSINKDTANTITLAVVDWITPGTLNNTFDDYYAKQNPAYRAAHNMMVSVSELRLVKGMTAKLYAELEPYIIALPEVTPINVNSAAPAVLMSLSPTLTLQSAKAIESKRQQTPFGSMEQFQGLDVVKNNKFPMDKLTVASNFFLVKTSVKVEQQDTVLYTLLNRIQVNSKPYERVIWQSKGTL